MGKAKLIRWRKWTDGRGNLYEIVVWQVEPNRRYTDGVRYRLAFIRRGEERPALLYDNHHPKGHHRHILSRETQYDFPSVEQLVADFMAGAEALEGGEK
ncbi:MAG: toxin-antitoxin system TumE family protein [Candidatus Binataceae bacterium]